MGYKNEVKYIKILIQYEKVFTTYPLSCAKFHVGES